MVWTLWLGSTDGENTYILRTHLDTKVQYSIGLYLCIGASICFLIAALFQSELITQDRRKNSKGEV